MKVKPNIPAVTIMIDPAKLFTRDMKRENNWKLESDLEYQAGEEVTLELCEFLKPGESCVKGTVMAERAKELGANLGQKHAETLLENQHLTPKEWRSFYFVFPGTVWRDSYGGRRVPYLFWFDERWGLGFLWLEFDWDSGGRLLRLRK